MPEVTGIAAFLFLAVAAGAAIAGEQDTRPLDRAACEAAGGTYGPAGLFQIEQCVKSTIDAGKPCANGDECEGLCIVEMEGDRVGQCASYDPVFGCHQYLDNEGNSAGQCLD